MFSYVTARSFYACFLIQPSQCFYYIRKLLFSFQAMPYGSLLNHWVAECCSTNSIKINNYIHSFTYENKRYTYSILQSFFWNEGGGEGGSPSAYCTRVLPGSPGLTQSNFFSSLSDSETTMQTGWKANRNGNIWKTSNKQRGKLFRNLFSYSSCCCVYGLQTLNE